MIAEAKSLPPSNGATIEWHEQSAYQLPLPDGSVDTVLSAQVVQFLQDKPLALREMKRVLKPGGTVAISFWSHLHESPYFQAHVEAFTNHMSADVANGLRAGFSLADANTAYKLLYDAGFRDIEMKVQRLDLLLPGLTDFIPRHTAATPLAAGYHAAPPQVQQAVIDEMVVRLEPYTVNGSATVPFRSHMARARK
jgi:ubiquinone/menaquinone biosynthesis C-methylase UbiE